jgi:hypothetical protein
MNMKFVAQKLFGIRELECDNISLLFDMCFQNLSSSYYYSYSSTFWPVFHQNWYGTMDLLGRVVSQPLHEHIDTNTEETQTDMDTPSGVEPMTPVS